VVALDRHRRAAGERDALDHVGIERALGEEVGAAELSRLGLEHVDEQPADRLALELGVGNAVERVKERVRRVGMDERDVVVLAEHLGDLGRLVQAHQAMIDQDAGELVADRLVDQQRSDRGIDAARKPADDLAVADLLADGGDRLVLVGGHRPVALQPGDPVHEIGDQPGAVGCVHDLGMELDAIVAAGLVGDGGEGRVRRGADHRKALGQRGHPVAMAHPDLVPLAVRPDPLEQRAAAFDADEGAAELAVMAALDRAAELGAHGLLAIADAEDRHAGLEDRLRGARRTGVDGRGRPARQDHRLRRKAGEAFVRRLERHDLGIDAGFAHAPGDELGHLAAEVDDQHGFGMGCLGHLDPGFRATMSASVRVRVCWAKA